MTYFFFVAPPHPRHSLGDCLQQLSCARLQCHPLLPSPRCAGRWTVLQWCAPIHSSGWNVQPRQEAELWDPVPESPEPQLRPSDPETEWPSDRGGKVTATEPTRFWRKGEKLASEQGQAQMAPREGAVTAHLANGEIFLLHPCENCCKENRRTPPHPYSCLEGCCVLLNQRKWALAVCTLKEACVCLNTALFGHPFSTALTILTLRIVLVTGTSLGPGSGQGSGLTGKERDRYGRRQARHFYLTPFPQVGSGSVPEGGCHCRMWWQHHPQTVSVEEDARAMASQSPLAPFGFFPFSQSCCGVVPPLLALAPPTGKTAPHRPPPPSVLPHFLICPMPHPPQSPLLT